MDHPQKRGNKRHCSSSNKEATELLSLGRGPTPTLPIFHHSGSLLH
jgi:hypothetical protein